MPAHWNSGFMFTLLLIVLDFFINSVAFLEGRQNYDKAVRQYKRCGPKTVLKEFPQVVVSFSDVNRLKQQRLVEEEWRHFSHDVVPVFPQLTHASCSLYFTKGWPLPHSKIAPSLIGSGFPLSKTWLLRPNWAHVPNGIWIGPAVFAVYIRMTDTNRHTELHVSSSRPHLCYVYDAA